uniref:Uncharacterized protein n=1 Tax=Ananas comosus var. bracteatus TaxID=296719 RepID=A0A6V7QI76_ANACO|nr:unnamed protein product [Ananas comosus var. bracteatus]
MEYRYPAPVPVPADSIPVLSTPQLKPESSPLSHASRYWYPTVVPVLNTQNLQFADFGAKYSRSLHKTVLQVHKKSRFDRHLRMQHRELRVIGISRFDTSGRS